YRHFEDGPGVIAQSAGERDIHFEVIVGTAVVAKHGNDLDQIPNTFFAGVHAFEKGRQEIEFRTVVAGLPQYLKELVQAVFVQACCRQFLAHGFRSGLVKLVDGDIKRVFITLQIQFRSNARQDVPVVDLNDKITDAEFSEHFVNHQHNVHFANQRPGADHVGIALIE